MNMPRPKLNIDPETVRKAERELGKIKESKLSIQLKGIIAASSHPVHQIADIFHVSPRSIFRWATKFKEHGVAGLRDQPKGHMRSKLNDEQKMRIEEWLINGKNASGERIHWTLGKLKREIEKEFDIGIGTTPLWKHIRGMGLVLRKPRPIHAKANKEDQEGFKKN
jgi:transposase